MKTLPAGLADWLAANNVAHRADCLTVTLADGTVKRWTTWTDSLTYGGNTYIAGGNGTAPIVKRGPYSQNARLTIDTLDLTLNGKGFTVGGKALGRLAAEGWFDFARVQIDHLIMPTPGSVTYPIASFFEGRVAGVEPAGPLVRLRLKSELEALNVLLPKFTIRPSCGHALYDTNCALNKATYTDTPITATGGTTTTVTTASGTVTGKAANYYVLGVVKFLTGALAGLRRAVKISSGGTITLALPLPSAPQSGDTFSIFPGCDKTEATCGTKFSNLVNFRGFPHVPTVEGGA